MSSVLCCALCSLRSISPLLCFSHMSVLLLSVCLSAVLSPMFCLCVSRALSLLSALSSLSLSVWSMHDCVCSVVLSAVCHTKSREDIIILLCV